MTKKIRSKADIEAEVRRHVATEKKAYTWVEQLALADSIDEEYCCKMLNSIMVSHYCDIIEERSISKVCGYPLCSNKLSKVSKQKYHISMKQNKIYDLSETKCFCSNFCFKASKYIERQIPESPIWLRTKIKNIKFLKKDDERLTKTLNIVEKQTETEEILTKEGVVEESKEEEEDENENADHYRQDKKILLKESLQRFDEFEKEEEKEEYRKKKDRHDVTSSIKTTSPKTQTIKLKESDNEMINNIEKLKMILKDWLSETSMNALQKVVKNSSSTSSTLESETASSCADSADAKSNASFRMKALNFLSNNPDWVNESELAESFKEKMKIKSESKNEPIVPHIHSKSQVLIRRKIVKDKLYSRLEKLQPVLGINKFDLLRTDFFKFVNTLSLTSHNIVLKPKEWMLATICLLNIYSTQCTSLLVVLKEREMELNFFLAQSELPKYDAINTICCTVLDNFNSIETKGTSNNNTSNDGDNRINDVNYRDNDVEDSDSDDEDGEDIFDILEGNILLGEFDMEELD